MNHYVISLVGSSREVEIYKGSPIHFQEEEETDQFQRCNLISGEYNPTEFSPDIINHKRL